MYFFSRCDMGMANHHHNGSARHQWLALYCPVAGLAVVSFGLYGLNFRLYRLVPGIGVNTGIHGYVILFLLLGLLYLLGVWVVLKIGVTAAGTGGLVGIILVAAVAFRVCLVPLEPNVLSKDMYRYIWDGRIQQQGINPYRYPPAAEELKSLRDDRIYPNINRKNQATIYPAGAQVAFRIFYELAGDRVAGHKAMMVFFDVLTLLLLTALLRAYGFAPARVIVYAWNPLVIFEIAYSGHLEGFTVFLVTAAFYLNARNRKLPAVILLALASAVKLYPALLLAALLNRGDRIKGLLTFGAAFALLYVPYVSAGRRLIGFLPVYLKNPYESFNLGIKYLLMHLSPDLDYYRLSQLMLLVLLAAGLAVFFKNKKDVQFIRNAYILTGLLLVLMPAALHPWYVILIIPFLTFYPAAGWLVFSCAVTLSYLKYVSPSGIMPPWVLAAEYLPLFALLAGGYILHQRTGAGWVAGIAVNRKRRPPAGGTK